MIELLTSALIEDLLVFLKEHRDFFSLDQKNRLSLAQKAFGDLSISSYLSTATEDEFVKDLKSVLRFLKSQPDDHRSGILTALASSLLGDFASKFDKIGRAFFALADADKKVFLSKLFPQPSRFQKSLIDYLAVYSPAEIAETIIVFLRGLYGQESSRIIIQSPLECEESTKAEIRKYFSQSHPRSFVTFNVNLQLIGGIRFFVDGKVDDLSWFSKVQQLHALAAHR